MKFEPRPHQRQLMNHILEHPRQAGWLPMGSGKTASTLFATIEESMIRGVWPMLVIAPVRVARSTWPNEVLKWDELAGLEVSAIVGTAAQRRAALYARADIYTINPENLPWLIEAVDGRWPFRKVVVDEATMLKGHRLRKGSIRANALNQAAHLANAFGELTGTPSPQGLIDLWGQLWFLDYGKRLGLTFTAFRDRWFYRKPGGDKFAPLLLLPHSEREIHEAVRDICLSVKLPWIPEPVVTPVYVALPNKARAIYERMERELFAELLSGSTIDAATAGVKSMKLMQLANGAAYVDETATRWEAVHDAKLQAAESIVAEANGLPVIFVYQFKSDLARLEKTFPKGRLLDADPETEREFNRGEIPQLFMHPQAGGHGVNLQDGTNIMALYGHNWSLEQYQQVIERIGPARQHASGHNRSTLIYPIIAVDTIDETIMTVRASKAQVQQALLDAAMRRSRGESLHQE